MTGYAAPESLRERLADADELLVIGCRLNEPTSMDYAIPSDGQRWTHVDIEPRMARAGLARARPRDPGRRPDVPAGRRAAPGRHRPRQGHASTPGGSPTWPTGRPGRPPPLVDGGDWDGPGVHPGRIVATMARVLPPEAIVATDAGNFAGWLARGYRFQRPGTFLGPTSGAMGYALPAAIAASLVHHERPVIGVTGDGGFGMTMAELETAVRERCRIVLHRVRQPALRHDPDAPGRAGDGRRASRPSSARSTS